MADPNFETPLEVLMAPQQPQMSPQMSQQMSQQMPQQMPQEQLEYQQQMQQQMIQQQYSPPPSVPVPRAYSPPSGKFMEKLSNVNYAEAIQSVIIIAILFVLFSNCYFKTFCKTLPFICITDGDFNIQSLIILGVIVGVCFVLIKTYII